LPEPVSRITSLWAAFVVRLKVFAMCRSYARVMTRPARRIFSRRLESSVDREATVTRLKIARATVLSARPTVVRQRLASPATHVARLDARATLIAQGMIQGMIPGFRQSRNGACWF